MTHGAAYAHINQAKADMDRIYDQPDPRAYFRELNKLSYGIPDVAKPVFRELVSELRRKRDHTIHILDLGCSYGVNAALLKHDLSMDELYDHWGGQDLSDATQQELVEHDRNFLSDLGEPQDVEIVGIDPAKNAVAFAEEVGLLDEGLAINLEIEQLPASANVELAQVDLAISTGCVGYVTERSFARLMPAITRGGQPWIANFVLRMFPFDAIEETLSGWGYVTEKLEGHTFLQRQFASTEEREQVLQQLREAGIDPTHKESEGYLLAEFYLSRPAKESVETPLAQLALA